MKSLLQLLGVIAGLINRWIEMSRQQRNQSERDELEKDPVGFFDHHFGGVRERNAQHADKADD